VSDFRPEYEPWMFEPASSEHDDFLAENERLRAALNRIVEIDDSADIPAACHLRAVGAIARAVLSPNSNKGG
jgi:hypothetical protein